MTIYRYLQNSYYSHYSHYQMEFEYKGFVYWIASNYPETTGSFKVNRGLELGDKL